MATADLGDVITADLCSSVTIAFFCLAGLELLGVLPSKERDDWIAWLWTLQSRGSKPCYAS